MIRSYIGPRHLLWLILHYLLISYKRNVSPEFIVIFYSTHFSGFGLSSFVIISGAETTGLSLWERWFKDLFFIFHLLIPLLVSNACLNGSGVSLFYHDHVKVRTCRFLPGPMSPCIWEFPFWFKIPFILVPNFLRIFWSKVPPFGLISFTHF